MKSKPAIALVIGAVLVLWSCTKPAPTVVEFFDGHFSAMKPGSWSMLTDLNDEADLQMGNKLKEAYCVVLTESKDDFAEGYSLEEFGEVTRQGLLSSLADATVEGPESMTLNDQAAIRYELVGTVDRVKIKYWHVVVDSESHFNQVLLWSLPSRFDRNRGDFEAVLSSLKKLR